MTVKTTNNYGEEWVNACGSCDVDCTVRAFNDAHTHSNPLIENRNYLLQ